MDKVKYILFVLLGVALGVGIFCVTVAIGCAINGISFGAQITQWFGEVAPAIKDPIEDVVQAVSQTPIV